MGFQKSGDENHMRISACARVLARRGRAVNTKEQQAAARAGMAKFHASLVAWHNQIGGPSKVDDLLIERFGQDVAKVAALRKRWGWRRPALLLRKLIKEERAKKEAGK